MFLCRLSFTWGRVLIILIRLFISAVGRFFCKGLGVAFRFRRFGGFIRIFRFGFLIFFLTCKSYFKFVGRFKIGYRSELVRRL